MESRIIEFAGVLRRNGVRVSTAETLDSLRAVELTGLAEREAFKNTLRATMVKRATDLDTFSELFDAYFSGAANLIKELGAAAAGGMSGADFQEFLDELARLIEEGEVSDLAKALLLQDSGNLEKMLRQALEAFKNQMPNLNLRAPAATRKIAEAMGAGGLQKELDQLLEAAAEAGASEKELERMREYLKQRMKDLGQLIRGLLKLDHDQAERREERDKENERLLEKSFYYLSPAEIRRMREAVAVLARRLKNIMSIRRKRTKRGRLDVKATLRASLEFGGTPFRIRYENKRRERPQVVILCDVSDSVRNVSRFMLQFVHSLQDMYSRVRSYVFVADIADVTRLFEDNDIQTAINRAISGDVINVYAHSDFGQAFKTFHANHLEVIDNRTTVIILGDARNNYNTPHEWVLRDIRERARQVIWLNPENQSTWGFGDSEMSRYGAFCDIVQECRNLKQLYQVVDGLAISRHY
ncbi:MAG: VWA domain-containing protein [Deltaproteobacteria bacterium]